MFISFIFAVFTLILGATATPSWEFTNYLEYVEFLVHHWAPLVWLAPEEMYNPSSVYDFLPYMKPQNEDALHHSQFIPQGRSSENWFLVTRQEIDALLLNKSFLHGVSPAQASVPVYALVSICTNQIPEGSDINTVTKRRLKIPFLPFYVTYWMFYPYNQGKPVCMADVGSFASLPLPVINGHCPGKLRHYGSHVGDWEHISLMFTGNKSPIAMYVSTHDAGAYYKFNSTSNNFEYEKKEIRRGVLQRPLFPLTASLTFQTKHPILFAAKGSHGLWTATGKHKYVNFPRLYDETGYGVPWETWKYIHIMYDMKEVHQLQPSWMHYKGRWGNPRSNCHLSSRLKHNICEFTDGPTGIPMKRHNFKCPNKEQPPSLF